MAKASKMNRGFIGKVSNHPDNAVKLVTISLGHIIRNRIQMKTYCDTVGFQWGYGRVENVQCSQCAELYAIEQAEKEAAAKKR